MRKFYLGMRLQERSRYTYAKAYLHQGLSNNMKIHVVRKPGLADCLLLPVIRSETRYGYSRSTPKA